MKKYRFVGKHTIMGAVALEAFGQAIELEPEVFVENVEDGVALIPESEFEKLGVAPEDLQNYCHVTYYGELPERLLAKIEQGRTVFRSILAEVQAGTYQEGETE